MPKNYIECVHKSPKLNAAKEELFFKNLTNSCSVQLFKPFSNIISPRFLAFTSPPAKWALANCWQAKLQVTHRLNHLLHLLTRTDPLSARNYLISSATSSKWLNCNQRIVNYVTFQWLNLWPIFSNVYAIMLRIKILTRKTVVNLYIYPKLLHHEYALKLALWSFPCTM